MLRSQETLQAAARALTFRRLTPEQWRMWRRVMRRQPQWYVLRQSGRRRARWHAMAGPFDSPDDARRAQEQLTNPAAERSESASGRWQIASLPETIRIYRGNVPLLVEDLTAEDLRRSESAQRHSEHVALV